MKDIVEKGLRRVRRAQGMTEYIIIVGLVAILLIAAVTNYKEIVRVTIEGGSTSIEQEVVDPMPGGSGGSGGLGSGGGLGNPGGNPGGGTG